MDRLLCACLGARLPKFGPGRGLPVRSSQHVEHDLTGPRLVQRWALLARSGARLERLQRRSRCHGKTCETARRGADARSEQPGQDRGACHGGGAQRPRPGGSGPGPSRRRAGRHAGSPGAAPPEDPEAFASQWTGESRIWNGRRSSDPDGVGGTGCARRTGRHSSCDSGPGQKRPKGTDEHSSGSRGSGRRNESESGSAHTVRTDDEQR
jgi:hypothetical protein